MAVTQLGTMFTIGNPKSKILTVRGSCLKYWASQSLRFVDYVLEACGNFYALLSLRAQARMTQLEQFNLNLQEWDPGLLIFQRSQMISYVVKVENTLLLSYR